MLLLLDAALRGGQICEGRQGRASIGAPGLRDRWRCTVHAVTQVHRHHPPLVYGRTMGGSPETSEGIALCRVEGGDGAPTFYGLITYT